MAELHKKGGGGSSRLENPANVEFRQAVPVGKQDSIFNSFLLPTVLMLSIYANA